MKKRIALATASAITFAMMVGPGALTVAAQDTDTDVRAETGWMMHDKDFKGRGNAFGHLKRSGEALHERAGKEGKGPLFGALRNEDLDATQLAEVRAAIEVRQDAVLEATETKMDAMLAAMESHDAAMLDVWTITDKDARNAALDQAQSDATEARTGILTTFRASMKTALDTFTATITSILGL